MGKAFFWQTPGVMAPYAVALLLLVVVGDRSCSHYTTPTECAGAAVAEGGGGMPRGRADGGCDWESETELCRFSESSSTAVPSAEFRSAQRTWTAHQLDGPNHLGFVGSIRLLVGVGAIPAAVVLLATLAEQRRFRAGGPGRPVGPKAAVSLSVCVCDCLLSSLSFRHSLFISMPLFLRRCPCLSASLALCASRCLSCVGPTAAWSGPDQHGAAVGDPGAPRALADLYRDGGLLVHL